MVKASHSLYIELAEAGIHVTVICPGFTRTEFFDVRGVSQEMSKLPGIFWMDAQTVAGLATPPP